MIRIITICYIYLTKVIHITCRKYENAKKLKLKALITIPPRDNHCLLTHFNIFVFSTYGNGFPSEQNEIPRILILIE